MSYVDTHTASCCKQKSLLASASSVDGRRQSRHELCDEVGSLAGEQAERASVLGHVSEFVQERPA